MLASLIEFARGIDAGRSRSARASNPVLSRSAHRPEPSQEGWLEPRPGIPAAPVALVDVDGDRVEIFTASRRADAGLDRARHVLTTADWEEIGRIRHAPTRAQLIAARVALRQALSRAVAHKVPPAAWRFARTPQGRPYIEPDLPQLYFSVSHTDGLSVIAVSRERPVGIDIEAIHASTDEDFVRAFLSRREQSAVRRLAQVRRQQAIIGLWSLKEAYAKMLGIGLAADLKSFEFHLDPARLMSHCEAADGSRRTRFRTWQVPGPAGSCRLALAIGQPPASRVS